MQFVDKCLLRLKAGDGGDGALAWRREAHYSHGGPFGGNGGDGGAIILVGDNNTNTLFHIRNQKTIIAENGHNGASKICHGRNGANKYIKVPCGTIITDLNSNEKLCDITYHGQEQVICRGGKGGKGNFYFKSSINQAPSLYERGDLGESCHVKLELQSIADVGLLGFPNAGKSTFLSQISNAKPKIASYPFTTLEPVLGVVEHNGRKLVFADIPGLIENASNGAGLGHDFLKHLNRCKILLHLIAADDELGVANSFTIIENELKNYSDDIYQKTRIVVLNKIDLITDSQILAEYQTKLIEESHKNVFLISGLAKQNLKSLLDVSFEMVQKIKQQMADEILEINLDYHDKNKSDHHELIIEKQDHSWNVISSKVAYWVRKIPQNTIDNRLRLKQKFQTLQLDQKLLESGAQKGESIHAYGLIWSFQTNHDYE